MAKEIHIVVNSCIECPYCKYDGYYDRSHDSGYDCSHPNSPVNRIVDDWDVDNPNNKKPKGWPDIPEKCPLKNYNG